MTNLIRPASSLCWTDQ